MIPKWKHIDLLNLNINKYLLIKNQQNEIINENINYIKNPSTSISLNVKKNDNSNYYNISVNDKNSLSFDYNKYKSFNLLF